MGLVATVSCDCFFSSSFDFHAIFFDNSVGVWWVLPFKSNNRSNIQKTNIGGWWLLLCSIESIQYALISPFFSFSFLFFSFLFQTIQIHSNQKQEKKFGAGGNKSAHTSTVNAKKIEESDELKLNKVDKNLSKAIQQARMAKNMTQKDLATKINEKPQVVGEYESGKAVPNGQIIVKMEKVLGVKLPRPGKKPAEKLSAAEGAVKGGVVRGGPPKRR
ncbi:hypothetical protein ACHAXM_002169 [Skeletonema potamos]